MEPGRLQQQIQIGYNILQPHVLPLMTRLWGAIFQQDNIRPHTVRVSQDCFRHITSPSLACSITRFVSKWAYLGSLRPASGTICKSGWIKGKFRATMKWNATEHDTWVEGLIACYTTLCIQVRGGQTVQQWYWNIFSFVLFPEINDHFSLIL